MIVLAFDGIVADTLALRGEALRQAIAQVGDDHLEVATLARSIDALMPGRTFYEVARELQRMMLPSATHGVREIDETWCDLVSHSAQQRQSIIMAHGTSLTEDFRAWLSRTETPTDWVLRADSYRRDVERWLGLTDLEHCFRMIRCADDLPRGTTRDSVEESYRAICDREIGIRSRGYPAIPPATTGRSWCAVEVGDTARRVASHYLSGVSANTMAPPAVVLSSLPRTR
ncbi:MAG: hypothetical protein IT353_06105 [Gemmatimonadaceae bacterium]|nr:hypothetical protein [Gemmatimonadaceae bacterium]